MQAPVTVDQLLRRFSPDVAVLLRHVLPLLNTLRGLSEVEASEKIYAIYSGPSTSTGYDPARDQDELRKFLMGLFGILRESKARLIIQSCPALDLLDFLLYCSGSGQIDPLVAAWKTLYNGDPADDMEVVELLEDDLWTEFFHFVCPHFDPSRIKKRVYIHCQNASTALAIMSECTLALSYLPGFQEIKIAGPGCGDRYDTIVAYFENDSVINTFLSLLKGHNLAPFVKGGLPLGVHEVMTGVGVADEPPNVGMVQKIRARPRGRFINLEQQSFGSFLCGMITFALPTSGSDIEFLMQVLHAFEICGVDPLNPHQHGNRAAMELLSQRGMSSTWSRRKPH